MHRSSRRRGVRMLLSGILACGLSASCQEPDGVRVAELTFVGNAAFSSGRLADLFVMRRPGVLPWSRRSDFDQAILDADMARLAAFYTSRGYPDVSVTHVVELNDAADAVRIQVVVREGAPLIVERVEVAGVAELPLEIRAAMEPLPLLPGAVRDEGVVADSRALIDYVLRDNGFARARVTRRDAAGAAPGRTVVIFDVAPGVETRFGETVVSGLDDVDEGIVRRALAFAAGDVYREGLILETQRRLARLGPFDFAHVSEQPDRAGDADLSIAPMVVTVTEALPTQTQIGVGYGSEDGPRGSLVWQHLNFLGHARQFAAEMKYSVRLRGAGVAIAQPNVLRRGFSLGGEAGSWWTDEPAYVSRSFGGKISATMRSQTGRGRSREPIERTARLTYLNETLRYTIDAAAREDFSQFDELIALGLDPVTGSGSGRLAALDLDFDVTAIDRPLSPRRGYALSAHVAHAAPWLGGTFRYDEVGGEARAYVPVGAPLVLASRVHAAGLFAADGGVPFSERYFLGGATTIRGWGRFEVSPLSTEGLPIGGLALLELSTEVRFPLRGALAGAAFVDAGNVWPTPRDIRFRELRVAVGPGLRWSTPFGVIRTDLGVQLTRIPGLLVNGAPEPRRWRLHFSFGHTF